GQEPTSRATAEDSGLESATRADTRRQLPRSSGLPSWRNGGRTGAGARPNGGTNGGRESERVCCLCDRSLEGKRPHARFCSGACRAKASRIRKVLSGSPGQKYRSLAQMLGCSQKRTRKLLGIFQDQTRDP